eukprot:TRINITY_DN62360_c0_g1_i1.p1 TRINITY_DN62360_c0_g1~~TRINITY_DN62360_c0_g1_i1.p1  ORF type:complete len:485 (+),score=27.80 TRINITY_DN62360_c0_g1_i1:141-1595(+)
MQSSSDSERKAVKLPAAFADGQECQAELVEVQQFIDSCENAVFNKFDEKDIHKENTASAQLTLRANKIIHRKYYNLGKNILTNLDFEKELECPVCLIIPRSFPIFQCRLGHNICSECHPRLPRPYRSRRCPVCQAKYCNPPTRNLLAEKLLECVHRTCRFDFLGCDFSDWGSDSLIAHETACQFRPKGFKVPKKLSAEPDRHFEVFIIDLLQNLVQLTLGLLVVLVVIFFLVSLVSVLLGSTFSFMRTVNSCQMTSKCKLNAPNLLELWNDDLKYKLTQLSSVWNKFSSIFNYPKQFINYVTMSTKRFYEKWADSQNDSEIQPMKCVPSARVTMFYEWPDTFLPSHLDSLVWTPSRTSVLSGKFILIWNLDENEYTHEDETRFGITHTRERDAIHSFMRWKLDMKNMPDECKITSVEMSHGNTLMKNWDSPVLYDTREIVIMAAITGWEKPAVCPDQKFQNVTWTVNFNMDSCRNGYSLMRTIY